MKSASRRHISNRWKKAAVLIPILGTFLLAARGGDQQVWLTQGAEMSLGERWKAGANQEFHLEDNTGELGVYWIEAFAIERLRPHIDLGLAYRQQFSRGDEDDWREENRPYGYLTFKWKWWNQSFSDRNQVEFRRIESQDDQIRYRNKLAVEFSPRWTSWEIRPYLADEIFADAQSDNFLKNRVYTGLKAHPLDWLAGDLYVMWESTDTSLGSRDNLYVAGLKLTASF